MLLHELVDQRHDETLAIGHRAGHAQQPAGYALQLAEGVEGLVAFLDQPLAAAQKRLAGFGQRDSPGGAVEQAGLQALLQAGNLPADLRRGQAQPLSGA
ncbi:hypothetical protein D3C77_534310 [compost metagenome]